MKPTTRIPDQPRPARSHPRGFALIVTLSLMILLTVIAVGLLTLSSITLRSSSQGDAMQSARANARVALMMAIGDLQKQLGPDTRISATADQIPSAGANGGEKSSTPQTQRQWAGAYNSWPSAPTNANTATLATRPTPTFLQWFVSGDPTKVIQKDYAATAVSTNPKESVEIVTAKSVGDTGDTVRVPLLSTATTGVRNNFAWWVSDLGTKGLIGPAKDIPTALADTRADQQTAPTYNLKAAVSGTAKPFETVAATDAKFANVVSMQSSALLPSTKADIRGLYHDFTADNRGLLVNVRKGGFRKDLSMELEKPAGAPPNPTATALYKVGTGANQENGINLQELWAYYNLYKDVKTSGSHPFTTSGSMASGTRHLLLESNPDLCSKDDEFYFKQPVIISYQLVLSFQARPASDGVNVLHIVADPIVTFWNPLDVPVVVPQGLVFTVKYWSVPYTLNIKKNSTLLKCPIASVSKDDSNLFSLEVGALNRMVFKPGEVIKMSQKGSILASTPGTNIHALAGAKGFNFGNGVGIEARTIDGVKVTVGAGENFTYTSAEANDLTAGATTASGKVVPGGFGHSRHFSLSHHEYYVGKDRGDQNVSVGIGGMYLDFDFGDKRVKLGETRDSGSAGTKSVKFKADRYNATQRPTVFKPFTDKRPIPTGPINPTTKAGPKMPFMLLSYSAKTEAGSTLAAPTRSLARFNPKALHVDFYNLQAQERDMLPYEYSVEPLTSWTSSNDSLSDNETGQGFFGGGLGAADGTNFVTTHSVPREPIVSLAAFQHSFANGFEMNKPRVGGYAALNAREPLLPQISHAIGNSSASPVLAKDKVEGMLPGNRPMADHSYLANQALWDDWFLSGIAPQTLNTFSKSRTQKRVAEDFFKNVANLPVARYQANLRGTDPAKVIAYFNTAVPSAAATANIASFIRVDGMFNVNSTSVEAWKSLLGGRKERPVLIRDQNGKESIQAGDLTTPVAGLLGPEKDIAEGNVDVSDTSQWVGRRTLSDAEIDRLARGIVKEVRKRGPFLCLADFINRRVGTDTDLARAGAIQNALDAPETKINDAYESGSRGTSAGANFAFPEAEKGPISQGIPGIVKQADILTPIAPILSARSDSFLVRAYGEKTDASGKVIARAWCEAVVQRSPEFIDSADAAEKVYTAINTLNKTFGRRFDIVSFRWLNASEA